MDSKRWSTSQSFRTNWRTNSSKTKKAVTLINDVIVMPLLFNYRQNIIGSKILIEICTVLICTNGLFGKVWVSCLMYILLGVFNWLELNYA